MTAAVLPSGLEPSSEAIADALRRELARPALKKNKQHAPLLAECQKALASPSGGPRQKLAWRVCAAGATCPPKRGGATLNAADGRLWLIGGADRTGKVHGDVWEYSHAAADGTGGGGWRRHSPAGAVGLHARSGHAAVTLSRAAASAHEDASGGRVILVHGGQDPTSSALFDDVRLLRVPAAAAGGECAWDDAPLTPLGATPEARNGHSLSVDTAARALVLFGGANHEGHLSDVHRLCLGPRYGVKEGSTVQGGAAPDGEESGGATDDASAEVVDVSGEAAADEKAARWEAPTCSGPAPAAREMHVAAVLATKRLLLVHGGRMRRGRLQPGCPSPDLRACIESCRGWMHVAAQSRVARTRAWPCPDARAHTVHTPPAMSQVAAMTC